MRPGDRQELPDSPENDRPDPRGVHTRAALIEKAEILFAEYGIESVSSRQIGQAIGSKNSNVVHYHFGNKDALVTAVLRHRLPSIEARRADLLEAAQTAVAELRVYALMEIIFRPLAEQRDSVGRHSYARFLGSLARGSDWTLRVALDPEFPVSALLAQELVSRVEPGTKDTRNKWAIATAMIVTSLGIIDASGLDPDDAECLFQETIAMMAAAWEAPSPVRSNKGEQA